MFKCNVCNSSNKFEEYLVRDFFIGGKNQYLYAICRDCNSLSMIDIPQNLEDLYENYYSFMPSSEPSNIQLFLYKIILYRNDLLKSIASKFLKGQKHLALKSLGNIIFRKNSKILDVGCGLGSLLQIIYKLGYKNCLGIDPFLKEDIIYPSGLKIKKKQFLEIEETYDLIMFHHVFEHFANLKEILLHIREKLSPKGICIIRIPNIDSFSFYKYRENWFSIHAPFHLSLPSQKGFLDLLKETQLKLVESVGEQLPEFFLYSQSYKLGIADYSKYGDRTFFEKYGIKKIPPMHIKQEIKEAKQRLKQVKKNNLCDWIVYYLIKE